jgi:twitching motility protein PilT
MHINNLLEIAVAQGASDLHLKVNALPVLRIEGELFLQENLDVITAGAMEQWFLGITTETQREIFARELELDFAYQSKISRRFRINISLQDGTKVIVCRPVKTDIPTLESLGLPQVCRDLALKNSGLVIITGPTGCGKSTTLAAMMNYLNQSVKRKIITIEDPVEYMHTDIKSIFFQREMGRDTRSFSSALTHALRQDPDVILVGEMRDLDTMSAVLTAAETGHLVLTTMHTPGAAETVNRFLDIFPPHQQAQVRMQLAAVLEGVIYQVLVPRSNGFGRAAALEVMIATPAIRNLIREGKIHQAMNAIQTGTAQGMQSLNKSLAELAKAGTIAPKEAFCYSNDADGLKELLGGHNVEYNNASGHEHGQVK